MFDWMWNINFIYINDVTWSDPFQKSARRFRREGGGLVEAESMEPPV